MCGRSHTLYDVYKAIEDVHAADPASWSLDLISGLPHLIEDIWRESLEKVIDAEPPHISVYDLQVRGTHNSLLLVLAGKAACSLCTEAHIVLHGVSQSYSWHWTLGLPCKADVSILHVPVRLRSKASDCWHATPPCEIGQLVKAMSTALQVEEGTPFAKRYTAGDRPLPSNEDAAAMYRAASEMLTGAHFEHYEISNFAKPGHRCSVPACAACLQTSGRAHLAEGCPDARRAHIMCPAILHSSKTQTLAFGGQQLVFKSHC